MNKKAITRRLSDAFWYFYRDENLIILITTMIPNGIGRARLKLNTITPTVVYRLRVLPETPTRIHFNSRTKIGGGGDEYYAIAILKTCVFSQLKYVLWYAIYDSWEGGRRGKKHAYGRDPVRTPALARALVYHERGIHWEKASCRVGQTPWQPFSVRARRTRPGCQRGLCVSFTCQSFRSVLPKMT